MKYKVILKQNIKYNETIEFVFEDFNSVIELTSMALYNCDKSEITITKVEEVAETAEKKESEEE